MPRTSLTGFLIVAIFFVVFNVDEIQSRPRTLKITINGHEWTVPDEPGWDKVVEDAEPHRQSLMNCVSSRDCRMAIERLRKIFLNHPVSAKYYDDSDEKDNQSNSASSIFKWG